MALCCWVLSRWLLGRLSRSRAGSLPQLGLPRVYRYNSWVWCIPSNSSERIRRILHRVAALLDNNVNTRNTYLLHRGHQVLHHQGSRLFTKPYAASSRLPCPTTPKPRSITRSWVTSPKRLSITIQTTLFQLTMLIIPSTILLPATTPWLQLYTI
jgi:hypothetical protein